MSSKAKKIGTRHETRVVKYLKEHTGIENIHRRELHGNQDIGDVIIEDIGMLLEIKAGAQTKSYPRSYFNKWIDQLNTEAKNAGAEIDYAALVIVQYGKAIKDAQVFSDNFEMDGSYTFWYLDDFAQFIKMKV